MIIRRLWQFFIVLFIVTTAYLVTVRAIISWAQVAPSQLISIVEIITSADVNYQSLKVQQTWSGMILEVEEFQYQSRSFDLDIKKLRVDLNIYAPFLYGISYGRFLFIDGFNIDIKEQKKELDVTLVIKQLLGFNSDRLWQDIQVKNSQINLIANKEISVYIGYFDSFKGSNWSLSTDAKVFYQQEKIVHALVQGDFKTGFLGKITEGSYSIEFLSPLKMKRVEQFIPLNWQASLPNHGELELKLAGRIYEDSPSYFEIELDANKLVWESPYFELPHSLGANLRWTANFKKTDFLLENWSLELSKIHLDNIYTDMSVPVSIKMAANNRLSFEVKGFSLEPFKPIVFNTLRTQNIKPTKNEAILELVRLQGKVNLEEATLEEFYLSVKQLSWPAYGNIPSISLSDLTVTKNNQLVTLFTESPILISSKFLRTKPVVFTMKNELSVLIGSDGENKLDWSLDKHYFEIDSVPLELVAKGDFLGYINAELGVKSAEIKQVKNLLPYPLMSKGLSTWLKTSLVAGTNISGEAVLKGRLQDFPFKNGEGVLTGNAQVENMTLKFSPNWPALTGFNAHLNFTPYNLQIAAKSADLMGIDIVSAIVKINNLNTENIAIDIQGKATSSTQSAKKLLLSSPLATTMGIDEFLQNQLKVSGRVSVDLSKLWIPVYGFGNRGVEILGQVDIKDSEINLFNNISLKDVAGRIQFTEDSINAKEITGRFQNGPIRASILTRNGVVNLSLKGHMEPSLPEYFSGIIPWSGKVQLPFISSELVKASFEAELDNLSSKLPKPFDSSFFKNNGKYLTAEVIVLDHYLGISGGLSDWGSVNGLWSLADERFSALNINFGVESEKKVVKGIHLAGQIDYLNLNEWLDFYSGLKQEAPVLSAGLETIDWNKSTVTVNKLVLLQNKFDNVILDWDYDEIKGLFNLEINQENLMMQVSKEIGKPFQVELNKFKIITKNWGQGQEVTICPERGGRSVPELVFLGQEIYIDDRKIDRLSFRVQSTDYVIKVDNILATVNAFEGKITGDYLFDIKTDTSHLDFRIDSSNVEKVSEFLGVQKGFKGEEAHVTGNLQWAGFPQCFAVKNLDGQLSFAVKDGVIEDADPGFARLIGLLSIESLARRFRLNLDDLTAEGLVFDEIKGKASLENGVINIEEFALKAPSADAVVFGKINLVEQTIDATVQVTPAIGSTLPAIAALTGIVNPLASLAVYILMKIVPEINEDLVTYHYLVTGDIFDPKIKSKGLGIGLINGEESELNQNDILNLE